MIPRLKPYFNHKELLAAISPTKGNTDRFEAAFARKFRCSYGIMFPYGRSGLYALLKVWNLKNAEVILPAYTCVVVPHAVVLSRNIPVFVDCAQGSFNMDLEGIRSVITERTRVVIPTHLFGYPMDVRAVDAIVKEAEEKYGHKVYTIQDCAHAFGSRWDGKLTTKYGDAALFGLNISKTVSSIFGGMITTNDREIADKLRLFRDKNFKKKGFGKTIKRLLYFLSAYFTFNPYIYDWVNKLERFGLLDRFVKYYDETKIEFPSDWDEMPAEIEARVGLANLEKYDEVISRRTDSARTYFGYNKSAPKMRMPPDTPGATMSHFVVLVEDRDRWLKEFLKKGIQVGSLIEYNIPEMEAYGANSPEAFPVAAQYARKAINFPVWGGEKLAQKVIRKVW